MNSTACLKKLLGHIERTSIQNDPEQLLVAISRDTVEQAWRVVMADEKAEAEKVKI